MKHRLFNSISLSVRTYAIALIICVTHLSLISFSQAHRPSLKDSREARIDSTFQKAENSGLNTGGILRYEFFFRDVRKEFIEDFADRLRQDSFETIAIYPSGKEWVLRVMRNDIHTRESIDQLEKKFRLLKFKFLIDKYDGFTIHKADPDPVSVPEYEFLNYLQQLSDNDLFWVANRLYYLKAYPKALVAFNESINRKIRLDTSTFMLGSVLVATHEYVKGIEYWEKAIEINPDYLEAHMALGNIFYENSHFKQALSNFRRADVIKPNDDMIQFHIAETLYQLQRYNEAFKHAKTATRLNRKNIYAKSLLKLLKKPAIKKLRRQNPDQ